jgi:hypothetical protein
VDCRAPAIRRCDFRLLTRCRWRLCSSGILRGVEWWFYTDVSGQPIGPIFKGQVDFWRSDRYVVPKRLFWDMTQRSVVLIYRRFGACRSHFQGSRWPLKMGPIDCSETSVNKYRTTWRHIPEEGTSRYGVFWSVNCHDVNWFVCMQREIKLSRIALRGAFLIAVQKDILWEEMKWTENRKRFIRRAWYWYQCVTYNLATVPKLQTVCYYVKCV